MKKTKLFLSLCMMCLSVAVLCMGILAANSATYNITGNMSYNMIDGVALVNTRVYKVAGTTSASDLSTACTNLSSKSFEEIERDTSTYYILSQKLDSQPLINTSNKTSSSETTSVDIVYGAKDSGVEYYTYYVVIEIKNVSTDTGYVLNAYLNTLATSTISNIASNANGESSKVVIKFGEYSNIVIGLSYKNTTTTSEKFNYTLNVSYEENIFNDLLKQDVTNSYWYVELGQVSSSVATKLKWRYVGDYSTSADGRETFTWYDYTATHPKIGCGSVFVQETALGTFDYVCDESNTLTITDGALPYNVYDYFESSLRESIRSGGLFSLIDTELELLKEGYIDTRTLPDLDWSCEQWDDEWFAFPYSDSTHSKITDNRGLSDYFWLMSVDEACLYFNDPLRSSTSEEYKYCHTNIQWNTSESSYGFWLRSPCYNKEDGDDRITIVDSQGTIRKKSLLGKYSVRASFRLA